MPPVVSIGGVHLSNSTGAPVAGGVATAAATTPFSLGPSVRLDTAMPEVFYSGGAPFTLGARPVALGYDNVKQTWQLNVQGTTHEGAVASLQTLKLAIQRALFDTAAILAVQPTSSSTIMYAEVYEASVQEIPDQGLIPLEGAWDVTFELTFVRSPFFNPAGLTTLINGATFNNSGTGSNNNTQSLGALTGDMVYEGQPLNLKIIPASGNNPFSLIAATVFQRTYTGGTTPVTTSSTSGVPAFRDTTTNVTNAARTRNGLTARVLFRVTALSAKARLQAQLVARQSSYTIWTGPLIAPGTAAVSGTQYDLTPQGIPLDALRRAGLTTGDVDVGVVISSSDGTSVSVTPHSLETLLYYTYCQVFSPLFSIAGPAQYIKIEQAQNLNGTAYFPVPGTAYLADLSGGNEYLALQCDVRGTLPLAISGASLYLSTWTTATYGYGLHATGNSTTVTVTHLPLFKTFRGA